MLGAGKLTEEGERRRASGQQYTFNGNVKRKRMHTSTCWHTTNIISCPSGSELPNSHKAPILSLPASPIAMSFHLRQEIYRRSSCLYNYSGALCALLLSKLAFQFFPISFLSSLYFFQVIFQNDFPAHSLPLQKMASHDHVGRLLLAECRGLRDAGPFLLHLFMVLSKMPLLLKIFFL